MARKRIEMGPEAEGVIRALMAKGGTVESVTAALRAGCLPTAAPATVGRRMAEMRKEVNAEAVARRAGGKAPIPEPDLPTRPEEIPETATTADYDRWIARSERMADDAEAEGDIKAAATAGRLVGFFMSERRKAAPEPVPDPNLSPDMVALGADVEQRFLKMIDLVLEEM